MAIHFRKSKQIIPGVKVNFSKSGAGITIGGPAGRLSISPKGEVSVGQSLPGSGIYTKTKVGQIGKSSRSNSSDSSSTTKMTISVNPFIKESLQTEAKRRSVSVSALVSGILLDEISKW